MDKQAWSQLLDKLKNHQITELELNHELFQEPCILQFNLFCQLLQQCQSLKRFTLRGCSYPRMVFPPDVLFNKLLNAIAENSSITQLRLPNNNLQAIFQSSKAALYKCIIKLKEIDLADNNLQLLNANDISALYQALGASKHLVIVNLNENGLAHIPITLPEELKQCCAQYAEIHHLLNQIQSRFYSTQEAITFYQGDVKEGFIKELTTVVDTTTQRLKYLLRTSAADLTYAQYYFITSQIKKTDADKDLLHALRYLISIPPTDPIFAQALALFNKITERVRLIKPCSLIRDFLVLANSGQVFYSEILYTLGHIQLDSPAIFKEQRLANALAFFTAVPSSENPEKLIVALFHELMGKTGIPSLNTWQDLYQLDSEAYKAACQKIRNQQIEFNLITADPPYLAPVKAAQEKPCGYQASELKV